MRIKSVLLTLSLGLLVAFSLSACGNTAKAPANSGECQEVSDSSEASSVDLPEGPLPEVSSQELLTAEEKASLEDLVDQIGQIPMGAAGSTLAGYEVFCHLANDFPFYPDKSVEADQVLAQAAARLESKEEFQSQVLAMTTNLKDMETDLQSLQSRVKDAGVELKPSLKAEEIQALLKAIADGAGL